MVISLKHATEAIGTYPDDGEMGVDEWNDEHVLRMASGFVLGRTDPGTGVAQEISFAALAAVGGFALDDILASTANGEGASLIGIEDAGGLISATTVEGALAENRAAIDALEAAGYLVNIVEDTTPQLGGALDANGNNINMGVNLITDTKVGQWDTAFGWGDHGTAGYLTSVAAADITDISANGASLITAANYPAMRALLDLEAGTDFYSITATNAAIDADVAAHAALTTSHGVSGAIVGTSDTQTLTGKTMDGDNNTFSNLNFGSEVSWAAIGDVPDRTAFASGDKLVIFEAGVGFRKIDYDDLPAGGGGGTEFADDVFRIQDNADATKELAFQISGVTTGTTRTWTVPDANLTFGAYAATLLNTANEAGFKAAVNLEIGTDVQAHSAVLDATTASFLLVDETKLDGIETGATADQTGAEIKAAYEAEANAFTDALFTKLAGIETSATADQSDSEIETAYNNQVSVVSQAEAEAGTSTTVRRWTALRVAQLVAALAGGGGTLTLTEQNFTGNGTWTKPSNFIGCIYILTGGGGGGETEISGDTASGGGAGGTKIGIQLDADLSSSEAVVIGSGGSSEGGNGGNSTFNGLTAPGGFGGTNSNSGAHILGGAGGTPTGSGLNITGGRGGNDSQSAAGGNGGASFWGGDGAYGSGGRGGGDDSGQESAGTAGVLKVFSFGFG